MNFRGFRREHAYPKILDPKPDFNCPADYGDCFDDLTVIEELDRDFDFFQPPFYNRGFLSDLTWWGAPGTQELEFLWSHNRHPFICAISPA
jgi:hypothetical protein